MSLSLTVRTSREEGGADCGRERFRGKILEGHKHKHHRGRKTVMGSRMQLAPGILLGFFSGFQSTG